MRFPNGETHRGRLSLNGSFQRTNLEAAVCSVWLGLQRIGITPEPEKMVEGWSRVNGPGRMEILRHGSQVIVLDGAHCPLSAAALASSLNQRGILPAVLLFTMQKDKDHRAFLDAMKQKTDSGISEVFCYPLDGPRGAPASVLAEAARAEALSARIFETPGEALEEALHRRQPVIAAGTLYAPALIRDLWEETVRKANHHA